MLPPLTLVEPWPEERPEPPPLAAQRPPPPQKVVLVGERELEARELCGDVRHEEPEERVLLAQLPRRAPHVLPQPLAQPWVPVRRLP